jgi:hypothetical protein
MELFWREQRGKEREDGKDIREEEREKGVGMTMWREMPCLTPSC